MYILATVALSEHYNHASNVILLFVCCTLNITSHTAQHVVHTDWVNLFACICTNALWLVYSLHRGYHCSLHVCPVMSVSRHFTCQIDLLPVSGTDSCHLAVQLQVPTEMYFDTDQVRHAVFASRMSYTYSKLIL